MLHPVWQGLLIVGCLFGTISQTQAESFWLKDLSTARKIAEQKNRPILVHFGAEWCPPCKEMERTVLNQPAVLNQLQGIVVGLKLDLDQSETLAKRFGVEKVPSDILLEPNGRRLLFTTGVHTPQEYLSLSMRAHSRYAELVARRNASKSAPIAKTSPPKNGVATQQVGDKPARLVLNGYCPVVLWENRRWKKGNEDYKVDYQGLTVRLSTEEAFETFRDNPNKFAPRFLGCDPVLVWETDRAVPGETKYAAFYDEELFLFHSDENRKKFKETPEKYIRTRVVLHLDQLEDGTVIQ